MNDEKKEGFSAEDNPDLIHLQNLFPHLDQGDMEAFSSKFVRRQVKNKEQIFDQDEPSDELFLILQGKIRIIRRGVDGQEATLAILKEGDFFGELSIFTGQPRSAAAVAAEHGELMVLSRDDFLQAVRSSPSMGLKIMEELSLRLLEADRTIASLLWDNAYQKILLGLERLTQTEGIPKGHAMVIKRRVTHQEIADMAGVSRETASRIMSYLKKSGAVVPSGSNVIVRESAIPQAFIP
jgi:CRP/FNR family transcriptional regulator/CRP/FNR family cyclic AMP-dependent transcriptional regulator